MRLQIALNALRFARILAIRCRGAIWSMVFGLELKNGACEHASLAGSKLCRASRPLPMCHPLCGSAPLGCCVTTAIGEYVWPQS
jgi:hypothetical protein